MRVRFDKDTKILHPVLLDAVPGDVFTFRKENRHWPTDKLFMAIDENGYEICVHNQEDPEAPITICGRANKVPFVNLETGEIHMADGTHDVIIHTDAEVFV